MFTTLKSATVFWRQRTTLPQTLNFFVTSRCNARCDFCLYYEQIENPVAAEEELTADEVEKIARAYGPLHYLALSGGEPFVRRDIAAICQSFIDHCGVSVVGIPSNFHFTQAMVDALEALTRRNPRVIFDLQMSIDHVGHRHDESRRVPGLFDRALDTFRALEEIRRARPNLKLKVNIVYLSRNREDIGDIVAALTRAVDSDRVQLSYPHRVLPAEGGTESDAAEVARYARLAVAADRRPPRRGLLDGHALGMRSVKPLYHRLLADAVSGRRNTGRYCEAGRHILVLNERGDVFPCEPLWQKIGNLRESGYDVRALLASPAYAAFRRDRLGPGKCNCTWGCAMHTHVSVTPRHFPRLLLNAMMTGLRTWSTFRR